MQTPKRELTFIVGSGILRGIETRFLCESVKGKSFKNASIDLLKDKLSEMDLSRYKKTWFYKSVSMMLTPKLTLILSKLNTLPFV